MYRFARLLKMILPGRHAFLWIGLAVGVDTICYSQSAIRSDSLEYQSYLELFDSVVGIESTEIINGPKYTAPLQVSGTHPFYNSWIGASGSVTFSEQPYFNLSLLYDIYSDEVIVQHLRATGTHDLIILNKAKVESFRIHGHTFKNYQSAKDQEMGLVSGFYDVLYESTVFTLVAKRKKDTKVDLGRLLYESEDKYLFIQQGRKVMPFRGMKNFYQILDDKNLSAELRSIVKRDNLKIKKSEYDLIAVARHCDAILSKHK